MKALTTLAALLAATAASAHDYAVGDITVGHPYALATSGNAPVAGGYMTLVNEGAEDVLLSVEVSDEVAATAQLHEMAMTGDIMRMSPVEEGIVLPAGGTVALENGGLHVMFLDLPAALAEGDSFPATLTFRDAGPLEVTFNVEARADAPDHAAHGN